MKILSLLIAFVLLVPSADAAVMSTTKQKTLPVIANVYVSDDMQSFGFDVVKAPTTNAYDVWGRLTNARGVIVGEWFIRSMKFRKRTEKVAKASFKGNLRDALAFEKDGTYEFTMFGCPANLKKPKEKACASATKTIEYKASETAN